MKKSAFAVSRRFAPFFVLFASAFLSTACTPEHDLVVRVGDIPTGTSDLRVRVWVDGQQSNDEADYPLDPTQPPVYFSLGVRLVGKSAGTALVNVAAFDPNGCLLTSKFDDFTTANLATDSDEQIKLDRAPAQLTGCQQGEPLLIGADSDAQCGSTAPRLIITGWGFHPQAQIQIDGTLRSDATVVASSRIEVPLNLSDTSGSSMVNVVITNPDGKAASQMFSVTAPLFSCGDNTVTWSYPADKLRFFTGLAVADLDGDNWPEIILIGNTEDSTGPGFVSVLANRKSRQFVESPIKDLSGDTPRTVAVGKFDTSGLPAIVLGDIIIGTNHGRMQTVVPSNVGGTFALTAAASVNVTGYPWAMTIADLDSDGDQDLALVTNCAENPYLFNCHTGDSLHILQNKQGTLSIKESCNDSTAAYMGVTTGHFLSPSQTSPDVALIYSRTAMTSGGNSSTSELRIVKNPTAGSGNWVGNCSNMGTDLMSPSQLTRLVKADFNKDGSDDLAVTSFAAPTGSGPPTSLAIYLNSITGFTAASPFFAGNGVPSPIDLAIVNYFAADSRDLLVISARGTGFATTANVLANQQMGQFGAPAEIRTSQDPATWVAVGDLDNDGLQDMLLLSSGENSDARKQSGSLTILFGSR